MSFAADRHHDLVTLARNVQSEHPRLSAWLSINDATGTVSDRRDGVVYGYVSANWTALTDEDLLGWWPWPRQMRVR